MLVILCLAIIALFYAPMNPAISSSLYAVSPMGLFIYWTILTIACIAIGFALLETIIREVVRK